MKNAIWICLGGKLKQMDRKDPRLDFNYIHSPIGCARLKIRNSYAYVYFGETREETVTSANRYDLRRIAELESTIAGIKERLIK